MNSEIEYQVFSLELKGYKGTEIAKKLNLSESKVSRTLKKVTRTREYELGVISVTTFLDVFKKAEQMWNQSNMEYQELIDEVRKFEAETDFHGKEGENIHTTKFGKMMAKVEIIAKLKTQQDKNMERILALAKQGELVMAIKAIREVLRQYAPSDEQKQYFKVIPNEKATETKALELTTSLRG